MTGLFTYRNFSISNTPALDGKVAVVTGGQAGIGQEITAQLLLHNIQKVFILARSRDKYLAAREEWRHRPGISLGEDDEKVEFIACDLADIKAVKAAAEKVKSSTDRLHIVICNAGMGVSPQYGRSAQDIEMVFATNCVGHQVLVTLLLPLLKETTIKDKSSDARVVMTSSSMHMYCRGLDLDLLTSPTRPKPALFDGVWRYARSKLGNILFTKELARRLEQGMGDEHPARRRVYVNVFFPGNIVTEQWDTWNSYFGKLGGWLLRAVFRLVGQNLEDGAATALYLAASEEVREKDYRGRYFIPIAKLCSPSSIAGDMKLAQDLWDWIDSKSAETLGSGWQNEAGSRSSKLVSSTP